MPAALTTKSLCPLLLIKHKFGKCYLSLHRPPARQADVVWMPCLSESFVQVKHKTALNILVYFWK